MENIIVAVSNLPCLYPLYLTYKHNDWLTFGCITFVSVASFVSHLIENHKHGMPGVGYSRRASYIWNRLDVLGCVLVISRLTMLYYYKYGVNLMTVYNNKLLSTVVLLCFLILRISEYDKYNEQLKSRYMSTRCLWHVGILTCMGTYLSNIIYNNF